MKYAVESAIVRGVVMKKIALFAAATLLSVSAMAKTVLITGANSGIGLEFARTYAEMGWDVIATHRRDTTPDTLAQLAKQFPKVAPEKMDVTDRPTVDALATKLKGRPIHVVINNAGLLSENVDRQILGNIDYDLFETYFRTNTLGAVKVTEAFTPNLVAAKGKVVAMSTDMSSITVDDPRRGFYFYYTTKAALNMIMKRMAKELADRGVVTGLIHPGFVRFRDAPRDAPHPPGFPEMVDAQVTIPSMIKLIDQWQMKDTGKFYKYDGSVMPW
jgi:NAD(P)-dependent dehydrogenase (short-subunit alcohol dehydrogenase family)